MTIGRRGGGGCNYETPILSRLICVYRLYKAVERESSKTNKLDRKQTKTGWRRVKKDEQDMSKIMRKRSRRKRREENVCVRLCTELVSGWACCTTRWTDRGLPAFQIHFAKRASLSQINYDRNPSYVRTCRGSR